MATSPLAVLLPILLSGLVVLAGTGRYLSDELKKWRWNREVTNTQVAHASANADEVRVLWIEARLRQPDYSLNGRASKLLGWLEQESPLLSGEEVSLLIPIQEDLSALLSGRGEG